MTCVCVLGFEDHMAPSPPNHMAVTNCYPPPPPPHAGQMLGLHIPSYMHLGGGGTNGDDDMS
jgi:hypothetical protein